MSKVHSPKGLRISDEVHKALRIRAAETGESMGEIAERALRKELGMVARLTWEVIEDNAGGLHLAVFEGGDVIYYANGYEYNEDGLQADLDALKNGADPRTDAWDMPVDDPQAAYDDLTSHEYGWQIVADQDGVYPDRMGAAAQRVFRTVEVESTGDYHSVTLVIAPDSIEVSGEIDQEAAFDAAVEETGGDRNSIEANVRYSVLVADALKDIADAVEETGVTEGEPEYEEQDSCCLARLRLADGRTLILCAHYYDGNFDAKFGEE